MRAVFANISMGFGLAALMAGIWVFNPLWAQGQEIAGLPGASSLVPAYLVPGIALMLAGRRLWRFRQEARARIAAPIVIPITARITAPILGSVGAVCVLLYVCLSIAQAWRGNDLAAVGMGDGEMWSYTVMLLTYGASMLAVALRYRLPCLRRGSFAVLLLAAAKVYILDAPDLDGLLRAGSFLALGLVLAGLAWIDRRARRREAPPDPA